MGLRTRMRTVAKPRRRARETGWPPPSSFFDEPRGFIDAPAHTDAIAREPVQVLGWSLVPGSTVTRVDVCVDGGAPERARLGIERLDIRGVCEHPDAAICGFEHKLDLGQLPAATREVTVEAVAHAADGRRVAIPPLTLRLAERQPELDDDRRALELRARSAGVMARLPRRAVSRTARIVAFAHQLDYSGGSLYLFEVLRRLDAVADLECELVTLVDGPLREQFERHGIRVHLADGFPLTNIERYEGHQAELGAWAAVREFDVALVNTLGCFAGADAALRLGIPVVWAVHESFTLPQFWFTAYPPDTLHPYVRARAEAAFRNADAVVFEAEATRRLYLPYARAGRLMTIPYGVEIDAVDAVRRAADPPALRARLGVPDGRRVVLCLGTIEARKSQTLLAEAFAEIADLHPDADLVLVGKTDAAYCADYTEALGDYIDRRRLHRRIRVEPITPDPYSWHAAADLLVCSSDLESLPRAILEAMAFGTPVLSTRVFGVPELIEDGRTGYLCEPRDVTDLARTLDRVLRADPAELATVARAASRHVRERHDPARYARTIEGLMRGLAADRAAFEDEPLRAA
jgi:D-inositol-3-phosphate glycosyltransferase